MCMTGEAVMYIEAMAICSLSVSQRDVSRPFSVTGSVFKGFPRVCLLWIGCAHSMHKLIHFDSLQQGSRAKMGSTVFKI